MLNWFKKFLGFSKPSRPLHKVSDDELYEQNDDVIIGYKFSATLQISTPLNVLKHHGEIHHGSPSQAPVYGSQRDGIWLPEINHEYNLLADLDDESASDIGLVKDSEYLPFLLQFREIYESELKVSEKLDAIERLLSESNQRSIKSKIRKSIPDFPHSLFYSDLTEIEGVSKKIASILYKSGYTTIDAIKNASDSELLSIKGIGKQTLIKIRKSQV